jgi:phosphatidylglycerol:prolipoprotein diacylglycerol transferase
VIPYVEPPVLRLGVVEVPAFWILLLAAVLAGFELVVRRAESVSLDRAAVAQLGAWTLLFAFVGSHVFSELAYYPAAVKEQPLTLLWFWGSMSSLGGMAGGVAGAALVARRRRMSTSELLRFLDLVAFAAPFGWALGRLGCALAHDHPGIASTHWLAVRFPDGPRFDLGLLECFLFIAISGAFALLARRPRPTGFYLGLFFATYGPARFALDFLRVDEASYFGWTPGQWASAFAAVAGVSILSRSLRASRRDRPSR